MTSFMRSGPLEPGEWVRLTDPKGRKHNVQLVVGAEFSTKKGQISHDDMIGHPEGIVIESSMGAPYQVFRPLLFEYVVSMPRGAAIIYPKDAAQIVAQADIYPGARVVEAGAGSGSLTSYLLRAIGPTGTLGSYEIREDFAENVVRNVHQVAGPNPPGWTLTVGDVREVISETEIDRLILDMVDPWTCIPLAADRLVARRHHLRLRRDDDPAVAVRRDRARAGWLHRAARVGDARARLAPRGPRGASRSQDERPHGIPRDGPQDGARTDLAGEVAAARTRRVRARLQGSAARRVRRGVATSAQRHPKDTSRVSEMTAPEVAR